MSDYVPPAEAAQEEQAKGLREQYNVELEKEYDKSVAAENRRREEEQRLESQRSDFPEGLYERPEGQSQLGGSGINEGLTSGIREEPKKETPLSSMPLPQSYGHQGRAGNANK